MTDNEIEFSDDTSPEGLDLGGQPLADRGPELVIISGLSGAGRTRAANALEDLDWYVVDNLPPRMLSALAGMMTTTGEGVHRLAAVVDVRSKAYFHELEAALQELRDTSISYRIIFLDAQDQVLVRRYEANRRPHPLQRDGGRIIDAIKTERSLLEPLRRQADVIINTSELNVHDLSRQVQQSVAVQESRPLRLTIMSFGFKYGLPVDADIVLDMRFLANPYWVPGLRHLTGRDDPVADYVLGLEGAKEFLDGWVELYLKVLPNYLRELKPYVTIAVGCTGGKHRSVASAEYLSAAFGAHDYPVKTIHRDLGKE
ncbi:RNase adaptor protein RapZ [Boudabousia liubingyangii]|uniref:RNase adapter RapZ n=1 Tax=Boudabousia liubingyangii TaxID=1921764 RepID=UPI00093BFA10|nr:RNase adapter RapZ [Boudabousia liubingyangii]OKL47657.1 RNase adaptor protein RapZ [Boudabousia liubingyangii]